jgi:lysylphosphatidylglycerol synthetase-like protein (DUF2156 family)
MGYAAIGLVLTGLAVGAMSRLRLLLLMVVLLLLASILLALARGFNILDAVLTIIIAQVIIQTSFVSGLAARTMAGAFFGARTATH